MEKVALFSLSVSKHLTLHKTSSNIPPSRQGRGFLLPMGNVYSSHMVSWYPLSLNRGVSLLRLLGDESAGSLLCLLWHHPDYEFGTPCTILDFHSVLLVELRVEFLFFALFCFAFLFFFPVVFGWCTVVISKSFCPARLPFSWSFSKESRLFLLFIFYLFFLNLCPLIFPGCWLHSLGYMRKKENPGNYYLAIPPIPIFLARLSTFLHHLASFYVCFI